MIRTAIRLYKLARVLLWCLVMLVVLPLGLLAGLVRLLASARTGVDADDDLGETLGAWAWRRRRQLAPIPVAAVAVLSPRLLPFLPGWSQGLVWLAALVAGAAWISRVGEKHRALAAAAVLAAMIWTSAARLSAGRPLPLAVAGLLLTGSAVGARVKHFRIRPTPEPKPDEILETWHGYLSGPGQALAGTTVVPAGGIDDESGLPGWDHHTDDGERLGLRLQVRTRRGRGTWSRVKAAKGSIANAFGVDVEQVQVDAWRGHGGWALVTILDGFTDAETALAEVHEVIDWTFDPGAGTWVHAIAADREPVICQLYDPPRPGYPGEGAKATWITGLQGGGKSGSADTIMGEATSAGYVHPIIIDCKNGVSLADWEDKLGPDRFVSVDPDVPEQVDRAVRMLRGIVAGGAARNERMKRVRLYDETGRDVGKAKNLPVTPESPCILLVLEEGPQLLRVSREARQLLEQILALYRAVEIAVVYTSQATTALAAFGGNATVKRLMRQGNRILHRGHSDAGGHMGIAVNAAEIPEVAGAVVIYSPKHKRDIYARTRYLRYPGRAAMQAKIPPLEPAFAAAIERELTREAPAKAAPDARPVQPVQAALAAGGSVVPIRDAAAQLRADIAAWAAEQPGEFPRAAVVQAFPAASDDQVTRALDKLRADELLSRSDRGVYVAV